MNVSKLNLILVGVTLTILGLGICVLQFIAPIAFPPDIGPLVGTIGVFLVGLSLKKTPEKKEICKCCGRKLP